VITLTLLHPLQSTPVQSWTFEHESVVRIGRSTDNHVILYSAVVSRHHVELRCTAGQWEIVNLGANGTYLEGKRITQVPLLDGVTIRLARSGPNIQISVDETSSPDPPPKLSGEETISQRRKKKLPESSNSLETGQASGLLPVPPHLELSEEVAAVTVEQPKTNIDVPDTSAVGDVPLELESVATPCLHPRANPEMLFCIDCGQPLWISESIGAYKIVKMLGQGGMGITYLAWRAGQSVVLKTLNPDWVTHAKALELFEREAKTLQQLNHPGIPHLLDFFTIDSQPYLVMEMVYGQTLGQYIAQQGAISQSQAIAWGLEVCEILDYLHTQSHPILHRDIKPDNLIQRSIPRHSHEIVVVDFGAVKVLALESGTQIGSTGYTAPEQQEGHATPASDLYSLGATLVYLLTGQEPITFYGHREQGFRLYAEYVPGLSPEMVNIIRTLTNPKPEERYPSAASLAETLSQLR
jgi:serine/threonine-protein kinase